MAEALPDDPVARAKAIALKLTATTTPITEELSTVSTAAPLTQTFPAPAPPAESGKRQHSSGAGDLHDLFDSSWSNHFEESLLVEPVVTFRVKFPWLPQTETMLTERFPVWVFTCCVSLLIILSCSIWGLVYFAWPDTELGKRKNRWGEDPQPQPAPTMPAGFGLPAALMAQATQGAPTARNKLFVPVKEHPEFNFMGVLIGPRGSSLKAMEQRTGAKILIRGKGSQKEQNPSDAEANEEMHVVIEGTDQAVAIATAEVEGIFKDPHRALSLKSEQLKNLANLNGSGTDYNQTTNAYGPAATDDYQVEMAVPNKMVGLIIGKGGQNIQAMQRDHQITIQIASQNDVPSRSETRPVKLKGALNSVEAARNQINQIIADRENEITSGGFGGAHYGPGGRDGPQATNHLTIPDDKVGLVIGKGGGTIKGVQQRTGANIQIPPEPDSHDRTKRTIVISAGSQDAADRAMAEVQNILTADAASMGNGAGIPPGSQVHYVTIPDDKVRDNSGVSRTDVKHYFFPESFMRAPTCLNP